LAQKRSPICSVGASITFSSTVISGKGRGIWKVRASPAANTRLGGTPAMSWPSSHTWPLLGFMNPVRQLKSVVLPAPLGPMRPPMAPRGSAKDTPSTARWPPKTLVTSVATNNPSLDPLLCIAAGE
jgi:hypothetical protein